MYKNISSEFYPQRKIENTIEDLVKQLKRIDLPENNFRKTNYIRLNHLRNLIDQKIINNELRWLK